mmetsp:Transcript_43222/g.137466  ORF Transcript_43222/g.137466 Transcript_43222/m.137466 type:complete len:243 (+) Transcript_43222:454-1182(+)
MLSSSARLSKARRCSMPESSPSRPPCIVSVSPGTVRADCWTLSKRAVSVLLCTVSPKPETEVVSSRSSWSTRKPPCRFGCWLLGVLLGLSRAMMETTASSSSSLSSTSAMPGRRRPACSSSPPRAPPKERAGLRTVMAGGASASRAAAGPRAERGLAGPEERLRTLLAVLAAEWSQASALPTAAASAVEPRCPGWKMRSRLCCRMAASAGRTPIGAAGSRRSSCAAPSPLEPRAPLLASSPT